MKLPKLLLGALLLGITVETNSSCNKKDKDLTPAPVSEHSGNNPVNNPTPEPCPACGMG